MSQKFTLSERIVRKIKTSAEPIMAPLRRKELNNLDFTIISNNCWGGRVYEYYGLQKNSPTIGSYIYAKDYIKFIANLQYYLKQELKVVTADKAIHAKELLEDGHADVPIGQIDDVEIVFLHYRDPAIAKDKWERRVARVNFDNLIIKNSYMCRCDDQCVLDFQAIQGYKKIMFVPKEYSGKDKTDLIYIPSRIHSPTDLGDDVFDFNKYIDLAELINRPNNK